MEMNVDGIKSYSFMLEPQIYELNQMSPLKLKYITFHVSLKVTYIYFKVFSKYFFIMKCVQLRQFLRTE